MITVTQEAEFAKEILAVAPLMTAIDWIKINLDPEDVFRKTQLSNWAIANGFKRE